MIEIILESFNSLFKSLDLFLKTRDLTLGAILAGVTPFIVIWIKLSKEKEKKVRSLLIERRQMQIAFNINEIMAALKVESKWSIEEIGLTHEDPQKSKKSFLLSRVATILRRKKTMEKLKSRKLWLAIFGALFPVLNVELGINLDPNMVFGVLTVIVSGIAALAHVDAKKAQAVVKALKTSIPVDPNATYRDMIPTIQAVHDGINGLLAVAKTNDVNVLAAYAPLLELIKSFEHPTPLPTLPTIQEDQVPA